MDLEQRIQSAETRIFKAVFPNTTNHYDTLFGGTAMHLMDEVAFITGTFTFVAIDENKRKVSIHDTVTA